MIKLIVNILFISYLTASNGYAYEHTDNNGPFDYVLKKITENIYVAQRPDPLRPPVEGNVTIIINEEDVVVVESTGTPEGARGIIKQIKGLTDKPVKYLINTHGHGDHTLGNQAFVKAYPGIDIISHSETRNYMTAIEGGITYVNRMVANPDASADNIKSEIERIRQEAKPGHEALITHLELYRDHDLEKRINAYKEVEFVPASIIVDDSITMYRGEREIRIFHPGTGDTPGDLWIYLSKEKLLITGDAVVHPIPYGFSRNPVEWLQTLKTVSDMDVDIMIPGHGEVQYDKAYLKSLIALMTESAAQIKEGVDKKMTIAELNEIFDLSYFEKEFAGDDPIKKYYFRNYFRNPHGRRLFEYFSQKNGN